MNINGNGPPFVFTLEDIKDIFNAGDDRRDGESIKESIISVLFDVVNRNKSFDDPDLVDFDTIRSWFKNTA